MDETKTLLEHTDEYIEEFMGITNERPKPVQIEYFKSLPYGAREATLQLIKGNEELAEKLAKASLFVPVEPETLNEQEKQFYDAFLTAYGDPPMVNNVLRFNNLPDVMKLEAINALKRGKDHVNQIIDTLQEM